ncbi:MAG: hypothetical protein ABL931_08630 [Usitatibacteraceae bacterium]
MRGSPQLVPIGRDGKVFNVHRAYSEELINAIIEEINGALATPAPAKVVARLE